IRGDQIAIAARLSHVSNLIEIFYRLGGEAAVIEMLRKRAGADLDPGMADVVIKHRDTLLPLLESDSIWEAALAAEPQPTASLPVSRLEGIAEAFAEFTDLKSPYTLGHS